MHRSSGVFYLESKMSEKVEESVVTSGTVEVTEPTITGNDLTSAEKIEELSSYMPFVNTLEFPTLASCAEKLHGMLDEALEKKDKEIRKVRVRRVMDKKNVSELIDDPVIAAVLDDEPKPTIFNTEKEGNVTKVVHEKIAVVENVQSKAEVQYKDWLSSFEKIDALLLMQMKRYLVSRRNYILTKNVINSLYDRMENNQIELNDTTLDEVIKELDLDNLKKELNKSFDK